MGIDALLMHIPEVPDALRNTVRNAGGGYVNHDLFFKCMSPDGGGDPSAELERVLKQRFGTVDAFKQQFSLAALEVSRDDNVTTVTRRKTTVAVKPVTGATAAADTAADDDEVGIITSQHSLRRCSAPAGRGSCGTRTSACCRSAARPTR